MKLNSRSYVNHLEITVDTYKGRNRDLKEKLEDAAEYREVLEKRLLATGEANQTLMETKERIKEKLLKSLENEQRYFRRIKELEQELAEAKTQGTIESSIAAIVNQEIDKRIQEEAEKQFYKVMDRF